MSQCQVNGMQVASPSGERGGGGQREQKDQGKVHSTEAAVSPINLSIDRDSCKESLRVDRNRIIL